MTRTPFDQFSKQYLKAFLSLRGTVTPNQEVPGEAKYIDILFVPSAQPRVIPDPLGLLGCFAETPCLLEPFRNPPSPEQICSCLSKLFHVQAEFARRAERQRRTVVESEQPRLWILAPSASKRLLRGFRVQEDPQQWGLGIYLWGEFERAAIVAINQLPPTPETLWLRLLGRDSTQQHAIEEVLALPTTSQFRANILELLTVWKISIELSAEADEEDRKIAMNLSKAYLEWKENTFQEGVQQGIQQGVQQGIQQGVQQGIQQGVQQGIQQGVQQGIQQGVQQGIQQGVQQGIQQGVQQERQNTIENFLKARFEVLDDRLMEIVEPFSMLPAQEYTVLLLQLANLSREELLAKFDDRDRNPGQSQYSSQ